MFQGVSSIHPKTFIISNNTECLSSEILILDKIEEYVSKIIWVLIWKKNLLFFIREENLFRHLPSPLDIDIN